jgi:hypothetical protein
MRSAKRVFVSSSASRFLLGNNSEFPGFPNCSQTPIVLTLGNSRFIWSDPSGNAVFSGVTRTFGPSFCRWGFDFLQIDDPLGVVFRSRFRLMIPTCFPTLEHAYRVITKGRNCEISKNKPRTRQWFENWLTLTVISFVFSFFRYFVSSCSVS